MDDSLGRFNCPLVLLAFKFAVGFCHVWGLPRCGGGNFNQANGKGSGCGVVIKTGDGRAELGSGGGYEEVAKEGVRWLDSVIT